MAYSQAPEGFEYIGVPLSEPMQAGHAYEISFWVSRADASAHAMEDIGAHLSVGSVLEPTSYEWLDVEPQIANTAGMITESDAWVEIGGVYVAEGGEDHLTIGNFAGVFASSIPVAADPPPVPGAPFLDSIAYYYVDGIAVEDQGVPVDTVPALGLAGRALLLVLLGLVGVRRAGRRPPPTGRPNAVKAPRQTSRRDTRLCPCPPSSRSSSAASCASCGSIGPSAATR